MSNLSLQRRLVTLALRSTAAGLSFVMALHAATVAHASSWDPTLLVNTEAFTVIDDGDGSSDVYIQFGDTLSETLSFDITSGQFDFSDDVRVGGNLNVTGSMSGESLYVSGTGSSPVLATENTTDSVGFGTATPEADFEIFRDGIPEQYLTGFNNSGGGQVVFRRARGTPAAPQALQFGNTIGGVAGAGRGATGFSGNRATISFHAAEDWSDTEQGTEIRFQVTQSGTTTGVEAMRVTASGHVAINQTEAETELDVAGGISGSTLTVSNLNNCDSIDTDSGGILICGTDAGFTQPDADARYVRTAGDTMTGTLILGSGAGLTASGDLVTENNITINVDNAPQDAILTFGNDVLAETLRFSGSGHQFVFSDDLAVQGTLSGSIIHSQNYLTTSGSLIVADEAQLQDKPTCDLMITDANGQIKCANTTTNRLVIFETVEGVTSTNATTDISFPNGTSLDKMFHFCSFNYDTGDDLHDQTYKATELTSISNLRIHAGQATGNQAINYRCQIIIFTTDSTLHVQRGSTDTLDPSGLTTVDLSPTLSSMSRSFVIPHGEAHPDDTTIGIEEAVEFRLVGTGVGGLEIEQDSPNNTGVNQVHYEVVDWGTDDIRVQHINDNAMTTLETTDSVTIPTAVNLKKTFVIISGRSEGGSFQEATGHINFDGSIPNETTVEMYKQITGVAANWSAQIIEDTSSGGVLWDMQRVAMTMTGGQTTVTAELTNPVDPDYSIFTPTTFSNFSFGGATDDTTVSNNDTAHVTFFLDGVKEVRATRGASDASTLDIHAQIITFKRPTGIITESSGDQRYVNVDGDTMTGPLEVQSTISGALINQNASTAPVTCAAAHSGRQWLDTDTGILYVCDTSNGRNKWLSVATQQFSGGEGGTCSAGAAPTVEACTQDIHNGVDANDMGWQVPADMTIVGGGFHSDASCTNGSGVDLEIANGDNGGVAFLADILTGCTDANGCTTFGNNIDVNADDIIRLRLDNNCTTGSTAQWSAYMIFRWRQ